MSLSVDFINVKKLHDEAQKANKKAWDKKAKAARELKQTKDKYSQKIKNLSRGNIHSYNSNRNNFLNKIHSQEEKFSIVCNEFEKASNAFREHKENLNAITNHIGNYVKIPRNSMNNISIKINPMDELNIYFSFRCKDPIDDEGHGHIILSDNMITYMRPIDAPHGWQNYTINKERPTSVLISH